jgi:hypothetical protein
MLLLLLWTVLLLWTGLLLLLLLLHGRATACQRVECICGKK